VTDTIGQVVTMALPPPVQWCLYGTYAQREDAERNARVLDPAIEITGPERRGLQFLAGDKLHVIRHNPASVWAPGYSWELWEEPWA
jgi:hypothetical protein